MTAISSRGPTTMRSHSARTAGLAPWAGAQPAISTACAWCTIMPDMNATSAALDAGRPLAAWVRVAGDKPVAGPRYSPCSESVVQAGSELSPSSPTTTYSDADVIYLRHISWHKIYI